MKSLSSILIIARPGQFRDSLQVLLNSIVQTVSIRLVNHGPLGLDRDKNDPPELVLLAYEQDQLDLAQTMDRIKTIWPQTQTVVLVEDEKQQAIARETGADIVLLKGIRAASLLRRIEELIKQWQ